MAVLPATLQLHWAGATGNVQREPLGASYTAIYRVQTDDPLDQAQTLLLWAQVNIAPLGSPYVYAGDTAASVARLDRIRAERDPGSTVVWNLIFDYTTPQDEDGEDEDGDPTLDPLKFRPRISMQTVQYTRPVHKAMFLGGFHGHAARAIPRGELSAPMSSLIVPYNPLPEMDDSRVVLSIEKNVATVNGNEVGGLANLVNKNTFTIDKFGFRMVFEEFTVKTRDWDVQLRRQNGIDFWEVKMSMDYKQNGWEEELLDIGVLGRRTDGDPDGRGGTISYYDCPPVPGVPVVDRLVDSDETPISDPVLLDGDGQPLDLAAEPVKPVYGKWLYYTPYDYRFVDFLKGIIT